MAVKERFEFIYDYDDPIDESYDCRNLHEEFYGTYEEAREHCNDLIRRGYYNVEFN